MAILINCTACGKKWAAEPITQKNGAAMGFDYLGAICYPITCPGCGATHDHPKGMEVRPNEDRAPNIPASKKKIWHPHVTGGRKK